jgi:SpoVK/Ycf46/Vps4 family AAA+-type ATPase
MTKAEQGNLVKSGENSYNFRHLDAELNKLDLLLKKRIGILRSRQARIDETDTQPRHDALAEQVDVLLRKETEKKYKSLEVKAVQEEILTMQREIDALVADGMNKSQFLGLIQLAHLFKLSPFELQVVIICLAPQLRHKYNKIYAYLQNDMKSNMPSINMVLDLLCEKEAEKWQSWCLFTPHAPLFRFGILHVENHPQYTPGSSNLGRFLKLDPRIIGFILKQSRLDSRLLETGAVKPLTPGDLSVTKDIYVDNIIKERIIRIAKKNLIPPQPGDKPVIFHFYGLPGIGKRLLALAICRHIERPLLILDMALMAVQMKETNSLPMIAFREGKLLQAIIYIDHIDSLFTPDDSSIPILRAISRLMVEYDSFIILAGEKPWAAGDIFEDAVLHSTHLSVPAVAIRQDTWEKELARHVNGDRGIYAAHLARQFRLTPGQIKDALQLAYYHFSVGDAADEKQLTVENIATSCRNRSNQRLAQLAVKVDTAYHWDDLVLEKKKKLKLQEICIQVKQHYKVFEQWGFDKKLSHGKGLSVLFTGPPGTGKTMAAAVIAGELNLDLYKVDLSQVVSKYIGETEKNLSSIFQEAETGNAILFFDEADALFGKRTEITDSHDRYANIETGYLLQKMEEYEGMVILATNLRKNMDEAFVRRLRFILEFPFPEEASRKVIWKNHFPDTAPVSSEIDYEFLSRKFKIAGGSIKNIVLNAAFLAANNGGYIDMGHILNSARNEFEKIGKLWPHGVAQAKPLNLHPLSRKTNE